MKRAVPKIIGPRAKIWECRAQNECRVNAPIVCVWLIHSSLEGVFSKAQVVLIRPVVYRCQSRLVNYGFL